MMAVTHRLLTTQLPSPSDFVSSLRSSDDQEVRSSIRNL